MTVTKGGAAGKGPEPPEPPVMSTDGSAQYPNMMEELDGGESEGKTKMAFAKMQIPSNLREAYLLHDQDFLLNDKEEVQSIEENLGSGGNIENDSIEQLQQEDTIDMSNKNDSIVSNSSVRSSRSPSVRSLSRGSMGNMIDEGGAESGTEDRKHNRSDKKKGESGMSSPEQTMRKSKKKPTTSKESTVNEQAAKLGLYA